MNTYLALTTINFRRNGYHEITRGPNKQAVKNEARTKIGNADIYAQTKQRNLIIVSKTTAKNKYGFDIDKMSPFD